MEPIYSALLFFGGILAGLFGSTVGSAGLISFPLLLFTGLPIHTAIATLRFGAVLLESGSAIRFYKEKKLNLKMGLAFGFIASIGSFIGSNIVLNLSEKNLSLITAILLVSVFMVLVFKNQLGVKETMVTHKHWFAASVLTFLLGIYGGFFGVGFGTFITFIFILVGLDFIKSAAISRMIGAIMSLVSVGVFAFHGVIHYPYALALGFGLAIGGWIGAGIGVKKGNEYIRALFIIIILATVAKLIYEFLQ